MSNLARTGVRLMASDTVIIHFLENTSGTVD